MQGSPSVHEARVPTPRTQSWTVPIPSTSNEPPRAPRQDDRLRRWQPDGRFPFHRRYWPYDARIKRCGTIVQHVRPARGERATHQRRFAFKLDGDDFLQLPLEKFPATEEKKTHRRDTIQILLECQSTNSGVVRCPTPILCRVPETELNAETLKRQ